MKLVKWYTIACLFLLSANILHAQKADYNRLWKKVDSLAQKRNLPKSALQEVKKIYVRAKYEGQDAQVLKALIYTLQLQGENREDDQQLAIAEVEKELGTIKEPAASLLRSLLANLYFTYLNQHRWQLYNRTATESSLSSDITTWALPDFHKKISSLYLSSLRNAPLLQQTALTAFDPVIIRGNVRHLRPTLYDLLAHHALSYFESGEHELASSATAFEIRDIAAFAPAAAFAKHVFRTSDTTSLEAKALTIYQSLIRLHLQDQQKDALIDVDLQRLQFARSKSTLSEKDALYEAALNELIGTYGPHPGAAQAHYLLAMLHEERAAQYQPLKDTSGRFERIVAKTILEEVVADSNRKSEGWINSHNLLQQITAPTLSFQVEKVNLPAKPFRALLKFKNVSGVNIQIIRATEELKATMMRGGDDRFWVVLDKAAALRSWNQPLPETGDLQEHSAEVKVDALDAGDYILLVRDAAGQSKLRSAQLFHVSTISYVTQGNRFYVLHRETGQPLAGASVALYSRVYDYNGNKYTKKGSGNFTTDKNGAFVLPATGSNHAEHLLQIRHGKEELFLDEVIYRYDYRESEQMEAAEPDRKVFFFTDRSIYRPGQTVYFKAIVLTTAKETNNIAAGYETIIQLRDVNNQLVDSIRLTTNEYGSVTGKFTLPQGTLNGAFTLMDGGKGGQVSFSVEEYKRPKFQVLFENVEIPYKVGDTIKVEGTAKGYAGNNVGDAQVRYRVVRQPRFLYPWLFRRGWWPQSPPVEISSGNITTDADGSFTILFPAVPDRKIDTAFHPVFDYRVYADVTDRGGETRSSQTTISAGYASLVLSMALDQRIAVDSFSSIRISTENLNGQVQRSPIKVTITKLIEQQRLIRDRYWEEPDQFVMTKEEFIATFPNDEYSNERDRSTWEKGEALLQLVDSSRADGVLKLPASVWTPGIYEVTVTATDEEGRTLKDRQIVELYTPGKKDLKTPEYLWTKGSAPIEPGGQTTIEVGTSASDVYLIREVDKGLTKKETKTDFYSLDHERKRFEFKASEADRGGFGVTYFFVKDNRFYQFNDVIAVPWSNKILDIEFATFRDKTLPGSEEKWSVKIKGVKGEGVAAEMLASMYDASLDALRPHSWSRPDIWSTYSRTQAWQGRMNFTAVQSTDRWTGEQHYKEFNKTYDAFIFNQYHYARQYQNALSEVVAKSVSRAQGAPASVANKREAGYEEMDAADTILGASEPPSTQAQPNTNEGIQVRKNLVETAFFLPQLTTDKDGNIAFSFTTPEALTKWKLQTFTHSKDLAFGLAQKEVVTQKELMVQPQVPRFLRQGDRIEFAATIVNLSGKELTGQAELQLVDAATNQSVDGWFLNSFPNQYFTVAAGSSEVVKFPMEVPYQFASTLVWKVIARAGTFSDGEEAALPVITNKILVTETLPLPMRGTGTKTFSLPKLAASNSPSLLHHALTVEYTSNPAWYAVQALPYLADNENESAEGIWNRYYANALASHITASAPRLRAIFASWKSLDTSALLSNLQKNTELKSALLEETPWVLQAKTESEQKKAIAVLFDLVRLNTELPAALNKLAGLQSQNGGFMWMKGAPDDRYITQYILTGIARLRKLGALPKSGSDALSNIEARGLRYLEARMVKDYADLVRSKASLKENHISNVQIQYLYLRSFHQTKSSGTAATALAYYMGQAKAHWMKSSKYMQGMIALAMHRSGQGATAAAIIGSLKETAIQHEELGMYWKDQRFGFSWVWWQAPIETQALLIEAFGEVERADKTMGALKTWLLKHKQTNNWRTTRATADACYALLLRGSDWLADDRSVEIKVGNVVLNNATDAERGTGYFKKRIEGPFIKPEMSSITVTVQGKSPITSVASPGWGAVYWQYFEDQDLVTKAATPLAIDKRLFVERNSETGPRLIPLTPEMGLKPGDKIKVRIELKVDRDMEYVHMKDLRASALEPVNVISGYKWQGGLGYYETTKDASTSFFFSLLRRGSYVFEYPLFVTHTGNFSNGITTIQSMYAPEFSTHSEGQRITVE